MTDNGSVERVALDLTMQIMSIEGGTNQNNYTTRADILDLYAECRLAAKGARAVPQR